MTTLAIEYDASLLKIGVHVVPALTVFHTPPAATATYQSFLFFGCTATSRMRPDSMAGPIERNRIAPRAIPRGPPPRPPAESVEAGCWAALGERGGRAVRASVASR